MVRIFIVPCLGLEASRSGRGGWTLGDEKKLFFAIDLLYATSISESNERFTILQPLFSRQTLPVCIK